MDLRLSIVVALFLFLFLLLLGVEFRTASGVVSYFMAFEAGRLEARLILSIFSPLFFAVTKAIAVLPVSLGIGLRISRASGLYGLVL